MTDGKARAAEPSLFKGLASSPAREATRRATRRFCKLFQPAKIGLILAQFLNGTVLYDLLVASRAAEFAKPWKSEGSAALALPSVMSHKTLLQIVSTRSRARKSAGHSHSF